VVSVPALTALPCVVTAVVLVALAIVKPAFVACTAAALYRAVLPVLQAL
jgi:hypothetical protein